MKRLILILILALLLNTAWARDTGDVYHEVQIVDERGNNVTDITYVSIYNPDTSPLAANLQTIYNDRNRQNAITLPMTEASANTTLVDGFLSWWGPDGYDFSITDGTNTATNASHRTRTSSEGQLVFPAYSYSGGKIVFGEDTNRTGEGTCLFANGIPIGMQTPGDCQGIKMEFIYGVTPVTTGDGKQAHGLDIKMTMEKPWAFDSKPQNATVRGARIQGWSQDNVSGKVMGAYINARAEGTSKTITGGLTTTGLISIEARTELGTNASITATTVGLLCFHNQKTGSSLTGEYRAIQIDQPLTGTQTGDKYGIYFADDHATGYPYKYAFGFDTDLDLDTTAHYNADFSTTGSGAVDGWISVDIDGHQLYLYLWNTKPS